METRASILRKVVTGLQELKEPLDKVLERIPESEQQVISGNLVQVIGIGYSQLTDEMKKERKITKKEAGRTFLGFGGCVVWIDISRPEETTKIAIAEELAHVFYNHPKAEEEAKVKREEEAKAKAREWGFGSP